MQTAINVCSLISIDFFNNGKQNWHVLSSHTLQTAQSACTAIKRNNAQSVRRRQRFKQKPDGRFHEFDLLALHRPTVVDDADEIDASPAAAAGLESGHDRQVGSRFEFDE